MRRCRRRVRRSRRLPQAEFGMADVLAEFKVAQAKRAVEQHAILDSVFSEAEVEANCHFLREAQAERDELFAYMEFDNSLSCRQRPRTRRPVCPGLPAWRSPKSLTTSSCSVAYLCSST